MRGWPLADSDRSDEDRREGENAQVVRHFERTLERVLDFLGYTIDEVVNSTKKKEHVARAFLLSRRIDRELREEPWRTEATARLGDALARTLRFPGA